jgi:two-component system nitrogen regulation sensor histidine kinase NtrY
VPAGEDRLADGGAGLAVAIEQSGFPSFGTAESRPRGPGWIGTLTVLTALVSALGTFLILAGATPILPTHGVVVSVLLLNGVLVLLLIGIVAWEARSLVRARLAGAAGARLHGRIVGLFSLVATFPTVLVAIVASVTLERGLEPWFSDRVRDVIFKSVEVADAYATGQCQSLGREIRILVDDLSRARPAFEVDRRWFDGFLTSRATSLGLPVVRIMRSPTEVIARANIELLKDFSPPSAQAFTDAAQSPDPICVIPREGRVFGALMKLASYNDAVLFVAREVSPLAVEFPAISRAAVSEYLEIDNRRKGVQIAFALMFTLIALIVLLSAIWFGLSFANRLVAPVRRLIHATDQVATGNFYVQVPVRRQEGDLAHLGETFNKMTSELRRQHDGLTAASDLIDRRRRFTEAVLSGVSAGVIGTDAKGAITIVNPSAESLLGSARADLVGAPLACAMPEIAPLVEEAQGTRQRLIQKQIQIVRNGRERTINVRVTSEQARGEDKGFVVTLDDITDLVSAQRTSAWADVARRIAHEIKNPLTPIQLSAERIRRKYGKVITTDREVFDQCTDTIVRQVDDIKRMVDEFSSFARMPKPRMDHEDLSETVRQVVFMMRIGHPDIVITEDLPPEPILAEFDRRLISQSVTNIIKNAAEAIAAVPEDERGNGEIQVSLRREEPEIVVIEVIDNGKGFPTEGRQRLLEPYMTTRETGTGLGLAIVGKILEEHRGGIELADNPTGRGGRVRLWFAAGANSKEGAESKLQTAGERRRARS